MLDVRTSLWHLLEPDSQREEPKVTDPETTRDEDLELETETVKDLDVDEQDAENIHAGQSVGATRPGSVVG